MTAVVPAVVAVGGTDSSGGAGLGADLVTLAAHRVHGLSAVTSVTAQGPGGVHARVDLSGEAVAAQLAAVGALSPAVAKSGMLATAAAADALADFLSDVQLADYVCDPVLAASSGEPLVSARAVEILRERLLPRALICTPNLAEAGVLAGASPADGAEALAEKLLALGAGWVLVTGGEQRGDAIDLLVGPGGIRIALRGAHIDTEYDRGTGCTLASAIAARVAHGDAIPAAVEAAKAFVARGLVNSYPLSTGYGVPRRW